MDPARQRELAALGGRRAHQSGHAHQFTSEEAREAGRKRHLPKPVVIQGLPLTDEVKKQFNLPPDTTGFIP